MPSYRMKIVVLSFDQLSLQSLGCYGNQWLSTPNIDRLATQSVIFDRCYVETVAPGTTSHAWWDGRYRNLVGQSARSLSLFQILHEQGVPLQLLAEGNAAEHPVRIESRSDWQETSEGEEGTLAELIQQGIQKVEEAAVADSTLIWLKALGTCSGEIPGIEFIEQYAENEGLEPTEEMLTEWLVIMSQSELFEQLEPDQQQDLNDIFAAARILEIDFLVGQLWEAIQQRPDAAEWSFILTSASGETSQHLSTNRVNVPLMIARPTGQKHAVGMLWLPASICLSRF
ncbi:MAG: sulfatase-like hydrolase/transferase [Planctomycetaceae bacterium]